MPVYIYNLFNPPPPPLFFRVVSRLNVFYLGGPFMGCPCSALWYFNPWVYIWFRNGGFENSWWENSWVVTSPCGGFGGPPLRKLRNMKYSRSYSKPIGPIFQPLFGLNLGPYLVDKLFKNNNLLSKDSSYQTKIKYAKLVNDAIKTCIYIWIISLDESGVIVWRHGFDFLHTALWSL